MYGAEVFFRGFVFIDFDTLFREYDTFNEKFVQVI